MSELEQYQTSETIKKFILLVIQYCIITSCSIFLWLGTSIIFYGFIFGVSIFTLSILIYYKIFAPALQPQEHNHGLMETMLLIIIKVNIFIFSIFILSKAGTVFTLSTFVGLIPILVAGLAVSKRGN